MDKYYAGKKLTADQKNDGLVKWLDDSQHYLRDIDEGEYKYEIVKTPELPMEIKEANLRELREIKCFSVINRGQIWYDTLTESQKAELKVWYKAWLDITKTFVEPKKPAWLK